MANSCKLILTDHAHHVGFTGYIQVAKPMAPFIAASALTFYLVGSLQDMGVKCASMSLTVLPKISLTTVLSFATVVSITLAETYAKDPRNPYAAQIAKESQSHH